MNTLRKPALFGLSERANGLGLLDLANSSVTDAVSNKGNDISFSGSVCTSSDILDLSTKVSAYRRLAELRMNLNLSVRELEERLAGHFSHGG